MFILHKRLFWNGSGTDQALGGNGAGDQASQTNTQSGAAAGATDGQASADGAQASGQSDADKDRIIRELRAENAKGRTENVTLKKFKDDTEAASLSAQEKADKARQDAEARATERDNALKAERTGREIERAARKLNIVDEEAAEKLLDSSKIEYDEAGKPKNIEALLTELVKGKPYLIATAHGASSGSATNPGRGRGQATADDQIEADWNRRQGSKVPGRI